MANGSSDPVIDISEKKSDVELTIHCEPINP